MISVCMATFNGEKYIKEQIDSILNQLGDWDELIISDDGSSDQTVNIVKSFNDNRLKLFQGEFHSPVKNFENAIKHANGDVIFLSDQDDVWCDNKIKTIMPYMNEFMLVYTNAIVVDKDLNVTREKIYQKKPKYGIVGTLVHNSFIGCTLAFRKETKEYILPFPNKIPMHDIWIALVIQMFGKAFFIDEGLILYRRHGENLTDDKVSDFSFSYRVFYRVYLLLQMLKRYFKIKLQHKSRHNAYNSNIL